jgi:hypothetical protein
MKHGIIAEPPSFTPPAFRLGLIIYAMIGYDNHGDNHCNNHCDNHHIDHHLNHHSY